MNQVNWLSVLQNQLGHLEMSVDGAVLTEHSSDKWYAEAMPEVVIFAKTTEEVSAVLRFANEHKVPVTTRGAGVGYVGGCVPVDGGIVLSVFKMQNIVEINPQDGVAVVEPGVITGDLQEAVADLGWYYPPDPASLKECSIGGNLATNAGGPRCLKYGVTKHYVLGLTVVLATGEILQLGGRCHKNKTGFDLTSVFVGSEGMLGVITQATLRIIPHPQTRQMLLASFEQFNQAAVAVQAIFQAGHLPSALEISDPFTIKAARSYLGADALPPGEAQLMLEIDGFESAVSSQIDLLKSLLHELGALSIEEAQDTHACEAFWQRRRDFSYALRATGLIKLNEDVVVPRSKLVQLVEFAQSLSTEYPVQVASFGHAGDGNIHVNLMIEDTPGVREQANLALDKLFSWVIEQQGAITGEHGVGLAKSRWLKQAVGQEVLDTHHLVKKALDPNGILNPSKFL